MKISSLFQLVGITGAMVAGSTAAVIASAGTQLNIFHINADDHRTDGLKALGNSLLMTPNLDSLAASGMTFTRCYTMGSMVGAVCTPSRTMMLTGRSWLCIAMVREKQGWQLFDLLQDPGQKEDVAAQHPDLVARLSADYDAWWESVQPFLVNEVAYKTAPKTNPFKELYWQQFGGQPDNATKGGQASDDHSLNCFKL